MRLFVAVDPSPAATAHLAGVVATLDVARASAPGRSTRVADPSRWHITLAFLGDVPEGRVARAEAAVRNSAAAVAEPIALRVTGGGRFGRGAFTILWAGLGGDLDALRSLADATRRGLRRARIPFDRKPLRPHLTLARPGDRVTRDQLDGDLATLAGYEGPQWTVDALHLYSSELGPNPVYTRIASAALPS